MTMEDVLRDPELIPYVRRWLFEQLTAGQIEPEAAVAAARRIGVELEAESYAVALFDLPSGGRESGFFSDPAAAARGALYGYFLKYSEYMPVELTPGLGAVLLKGEARRMEKLTERCIRTVEEEYARGGVEDWYLAVSRPAAGLEELPACFQQASRLRALRVIRPERHVFRPGMELSPGQPPEGAPLPDAMPEGADPAVIQTFLHSGSREQVSAFVRGYLRDLGGAMGSLPFRDYILLSARFTAEKFVRELGVPRERYADRLGPWTEGAAEPERFLRETLETAVALRDETSGGGKTGALGSALEYVRGHFTDPALSLAETAAHAGVTASYLSALFRRELDCTFTQFVTGRRMELARSLLRGTDRRSGQIARDVGFRDGRYFSALFRKTYGCTPGQFRAGTGDR